MISAPARKSLRGLGDPVSELAQRIVAENPLAATVGRLTVDSVDSDIRKALGRDYRLVSGRSANAIDTSELINKLPVSHRTILSQYIDQYSIVPTQSVGGPAPGSAFDTQAFTQQMSQRTSWPFQSSVATGKNRDISSVINARYAAQKKTDWQARLPWIIGIGGLLLISTLVLSISGD